ncbi:unnamed protein product, partial [Rotaria sp. Silwood2]
MKKQCQLNYDRCLRCGCDWKTGDHSECSIKCHHCSGEHLSTDYKCPALADYRCELVKELKRHPERLPEHVQLFIPAQCGDRNDHSPVITNYQKNEQKIRSTVNATFATYNPQICIWTGVGAGIKNPPQIPFYNWVCQEGTDSFGGVAMIVHNSLKTKTALQTPNFILIELTVLTESVLIGAIYVPPSSGIPFNLLETHKDTFFGKIYTQTKGVHTNKNKQKINYLGSQGNNIWKLVRPVFHPFSPSLSGLTTNNGIIKNPQTIADTLVDHYEKHFEPPMHDSGILAHLEALEAYTNVSYLPNLPLEQISIEEVQSSLKRIQNKKSTDCDGISAFHMKQMPDEFMKIITIGFNKMAETGTYLKRSKHVK